MPLVVGSCSNSKVHLTSTVVNDEDAGRLDAENANSACVGTRIEYPCGDGAVCLAIQAGCGAMTGIDPDNSRLIGYPLCCDDPRVAYEFTVADSAILVCNGLSS